MTETTTSRAAAPKRGRKDSFRTIVEPSAELLSLIKADPAVSLEFVRDDSGAGAGGRTIPSVQCRTESTANHGCPHCGEDFSVTLPEHSSAESHDVRVSCPGCAGAVLVSVAADLSPGQVEVGPAWDLVPPRRIRDRVRELLASHRDLPAAHAERIARLEDELAEAQRQARTDYVTGLLNERAHAADSEGRDLGHGVMIVPAVELVYDRCGQSSGNRIANDAARILRAAARDRVHLYRMGSAKFALIGPDVDVIKSVLEDIRAALAAATLSVARGDEVPPAGARNLEEHLDLHPKPFGLEVRMRLAGPGGTRVPDPSVRSLMAP